MSDTTLALPSQKQTNKQTKESFGTSENNPRWNLDSNRTKQTFFFQELPTRQEQATAEHPMEWNVSKIFQEPCDSFN